MTELGPRIIVALDHPDGRSALEFCARLDPGDCRVKVGKELFTSAGPAVVEALRDRGFEVFLDLKYHDIPNTVAAACRAAGRLGVWMLDVHAAGGRAMLTAARESLAVIEPRPLLIAVTVLTSLDQQDLADTGVVDGPTAQVARLTQLSADCGLDGVVCSAQDLTAPRASAGDGLLRITPGIRPLAALTGDQKRTMTPAEAVQAGADYLVIGRPITRAADPRAALVTIRSEIAAV